MDGSTQESHRARTPDCIPCTFAKSGYPQADDSAQESPVVKWSDLEVSVVGKNGKPKSVSFEIATIKYVEKFYPNLGTRTYRIPASLSYPPESLENAESVETAKMRSDLDSNEDIVRALDSWGKEGQEPMLILIEYKMNSYLKNVEMKSKNAKKELNKLKSKGDHDIMVLHKKFGVMFLQLKACKQSTGYKNKRTVLKKALEQLDRDVKFFRVMNQDLPYSASLPLKTYVALHKLSKKDLSDIGVCEAHKANILTKTEISTNSEFKRWLESVGFANYDQRDKKGAFSAEQFTEMFGRYAGLASMTQTRPYFKALKNSALSVKKLLLTPQQMALLSAKERKVILLGDFGSGKSLVITKMAENLTKTSDDGSIRVFIISCASVSRTRMPGVITDAPDYFMQFLSKDIINRNIEVKSVKEVIPCELQDKSDTATPLPTKKNSESTLQLSPEEILRIVDMLCNKYYPKKVHVFFDELPFISSWDWRKLDSLVDTYPDMYVWFVLASGTYNLQRDYNHVEHMQMLLPRFHVERLKESIRMTQKCYKVYQAMKEYAGIDDSTLTNYGNFVPGTDPLWYPLSDCLCSQKISFFYPMECECLKERLFQVFCEIWQYHLRGFDLDKICIILGDKHVKCVTDFLAGHVGNALTQLKIRHDGYGSPGSNGSLHPFDGVKRVSIVDHVSFKGCEKPIVIVICPYESPLVWHSHAGRFGSDFPVCRALSNVFFVTLSSSERKYFEDKAIEETTKRHWNIAGKSFSEEQSQLCDSARQYVARHGMDFYEYLVKERVLIKCTMDKISERPDPDGEINEPPETFFFSDLRNNENAEN